MDIPGLQEDAVRGEVGRKLLDAVRDGAAGNGHEGHSEPPRHSARADIHYDSEPRECARGNNTPRRVAAPNLARARPFSRCAVLSKTFAGAAAVLLALALTSLRYSAILPYLTRDVW